jgi:SAM-dependent MidA family methyltransferase
MSFHDFMEMALYHPGLGYYTSPVDKIGPAGDFYTGSTLSPAFGAMLGRQLAEMQGCLGGDEFTIVEYGAGTGALCHSILDYLKNNTALYDKLRYCIIEKSPAMREKETAHLPGNVYWYDSIQQLQPVSGCILSNELVDNFAVHQVVMQDELMEVFVSCQDGRFTELLQPAAPALVNYLSELHVSLPRGFRTEINLEATNWIADVATALGTGYVITIDYGYPSSELYRAHRRNGTLLCYNKHTINEDPYRNIGSQDITTHVNFSALHHWGEKHGLQGCGFTDQAHFLFSLGIHEYTKAIAGHLSGKEYIRQLFLQHELLNGMGDKFKVLIQQKGLPVHELTGLKTSPYIKVAQAA